MVQPLYKTVWQFIKKLNMQLPYDPAITLLGIYPREMKTYVHTKPYKQIFLPALYITAQNWKQPICPFSFFLINLFILFYLFLAVLGLRCCMWAFSSCSERGLLLVAVRGLLIVVASLCCRAWALGVRTSVIVVCGLSCVA